MATYKFFQHKEKKKSTFILDPHSYYSALEDPFELKELESYNMVKAHIENHKKCYVATSHGKDSLVLVHLVWRAAKELGMEDKVEYQLNDTLNTYIEEKPFWDLFNKWLGIEDKFRVFTPPKLPNGKQSTVWSIAEFVGHLPDFRRTSQGGKSTKTNKIPECCEWLKKKSIKKYLKSLKKEERYDLEFIGTRGAESRIRRMVVLQYCRTHITKWRKVYPIRTVTPLSFWKSTDIYLYFDKYKLPKNPTYEIHKLKRLGCASCPAYKHWELVLASDPTEQGRGMLKQNMLILKKTDRVRFAKSLQVLRESNLVPELVAELEGSRTLLHWFK